MTEERDYASVAIWSQTRVMVFEQAAERFVNPLKQSDFELRIRGKPQRFQFLNQLTARCARNEEAQLAAARGLSPTRREMSHLSLCHWIRGRTVFFTLMSLHCQRVILFSARKVLLHFIEKDMGQNDVGSHRALC